MKKIVFLLAFFAGASWALAQKTDKKDVPGTAVHMLDSLYPKAGDAEWMKMNNNHTAKFSDSGKEMLVEFDSEGKLVKTEIETELSSLPNAIHMYMIKFYPQTKIDKAFTSTNAADGKTGYRAEVGEQNLFFDSNGEFIKSEKRTMWEEPEKAAQHKR